MERAFLLRGRGDGKVGKVAGVEKIEDEVALMIADINATSRRGVCSKHVLRKYFLSAILKGTSSLLITAYDAGFSREVI